MKAEPIQRYGKLTTTGNKYLKPGIKDPSKTSAWVEVKCDCGTVKFVNRSNLVKGNNRGLKSCGAKTCIPVKPVTDNKVLLGKWYSMGKNKKGWDTFAIFEDWSIQLGWQEGYWLIREDSNETYSPWNCSWMDKNVYIESLRVYTPVVVKEPSLQKQYPKLANVWKAMRHRCNPTYQSGIRNRNYIKNGIKVCEEWGTSFATFVEWALNNGYEEGLTIERKENLIGYCPENCTWIPKSKQGANICTNHLITAWGETKHILGWQRDDRVKIGVYAAIKRVEKEGWTFEDALSTPAFCIPGTNIRKPVIKRNYNKYTKHHNPKYDITVFGETKRIKEWTIDSRCAVTEGCLRVRLSKGWPSESALTLPKYWRI